MLIKKADDPTAALARLEHLTKTTGPPVRRFALEEELRRRRAGLRSAAETLYRIDREWGRAKDVAVLHDLRLEHGGQVVEIDHLLIDRSLNVFVLESRTAEAGIRITEAGKFLRFNAGRRSFESIPSPLARAERQAAVLQEVLRPLLPLRPDGEDWAPAFHALVVIPAGARVERPKGLDTGRVIEAERLGEAVSRILEAAARPGLSGEDTLALARRLAALHRPAPAGLSNAWAGAGAAKSFASPDSPGDWALEPLAEDGGAVRRGSGGKAFWLRLLVWSAVLLTLLAALAAGGVFGPGFGFGPKPAAAPPPGLGKSPRPSGTAAESKPRPMPPEPGGPAAEPRWTSPKARPPARAPEPPAAPPPPTDTGATSPGRPELPRAAPAESRRLERPAVQQDAESLRARGREGKPVAEIKGNLPKIRQEMHDSSLGIQPANPEPAEAPRCRPGAVMTDAEIAACRESARRNR